MAAKSSKDVGQEEKLEKEHFERVISAFHFYREFSMKKLVRKSKQDFKRLPERHKSMLPNFLSHIKRLEQAIEVNHKMVRRIVESTDHMFENTNHSVNNNETKMSKLVSEYEMDKVVTAIKQFFRDWSDEGKAEREACYKPIVDEIQHLFPPDSCDPSCVSVLVPGAGLARLMFEIAKKGYRCQGNEFSLFMLFASNFILNRCRGTYHTKIYPFVHQVTNNWTSDDQLVPVLIPDIDPSSLPSSSSFSMAAGDFLDVYFTDEETWDCVASCFFIDTAHNILSYIETIHRILKPGGYWVNLGPLLYHFAGLANEHSIEMSYEEVRRIIVKEFGFEILKEDTRSCSYIQNPRSMMKMTYECVFFVARKPTNSVSDSSR